MTEANTVVTVERIIHFDEIEEAVIVASNVTPSNFTIVCTCDWYTNIATLDIDTAIAQAERHLRACHGPLPTDPFEGIA